MPPADSAALIVARFLKANHYSESYTAFISEAGLDDSAGTVSKGDLTLETLLEEKKTFDVALRFEKLGVGEEGERGWRRPAPSKGQIIKTLPTSSNILSTIIASLATSSRSDITQRCLIATTADRRLHILRLPSLELHASYSTLSDAPILSCTAFSSSMLFCTTMSGTLLAINPEGRVLDKRKDHTKYVVACAVFRPDSGRDELVATASWDNKVHIYRPTSTASSPSPSFELGAPVATITLPTKPESLLFLTHPETSEPIILLSRTDSSFLYYYTLPTTTATTPAAEPQLLGKQNLAPHSNAWVAFTPSSLALHPTDPTLLAVGTNSIPHMILLMVRLLIPPTHPHTSTGSAAAPSAIASLLNNNNEPVVQETQASQARAALAVADREHAAILIHANTLAPQTAYSTPCVVWRPDGSGAWVNGDDGVVRGVEAKTGKGTAALGGLEGERKGGGDEGHEAGSKVRCLAAGVAGGEGEGEEVMVSGGFDQRLIVWRSGDEV